MEVIGRIKEQYILRNTLTKGESQLMAVYGRRRVGKTYLIENTLRKEIVFDITGIKGNNKRLQLKNFKTQLEKRLTKNKSIPTPTNWFDAFQLLQNYIASHKGEKKVIYIDEFPWFCGQRSDFLPVFEHFWNNFCAKRNDVIVIVCGSAASFMVNKIIYNKDGLHGRISETIRLKPFNLSETHEYIKYKQIKMNSYDILKCYMIFGGIPHYLNQLDKRYTLDQNIDRLCFETGGQLVNEFNEVLISLFKNSTLHKKIIIELAKKRVGLTRKSLVDKLRTGNNSNFTKTLRELEESGFIIECPSFLLKETKNLFRLNDEFCFFYLKYIKPNKGQGQGTWLHISNSPSFKSWSGFAFEMVCMKHTQQIKKALGISKVRTTTHSWYSKEIPEKGLPGAQIDMLLHRQDRRIDLIETKFYENPFVITKSYHQNLLNKKNVFREIAKPKDAVAFILIASNGIHQNKYTNILTDSFSSEILFQND